MTRTRRIVLAVVTAIVVAGAGVAAVLLIRPGQGTSTVTSMSAAAARVSTPPPPAPPLSVQRASALSQDLGAGTLSGLRAAVAVANSQPLDSSAAGQLAALGPITFDVSTFHDNHNGTAAVTAHVAHPSFGSSAIWTVALVDEAGQWKLSLTDPDS